MKRALVTGASTGIGRATALRLAEDGFDVVATVRRPADGDALVRATYGSLTPMIMDVTDSATIARAAKSVFEQVGVDGLDVLVNNAGIGVFLPLELVPADQLRRQFEVNVDGRIAVTQAFLPMLRLARGRIVMIGSIGGRITMPFAGPQAAAKHAVVALTEALRLELAPWGIRVILVEPASIRTDAIDELARDSEAAPEKFGPQGSALYGETYRRWAARALAREEHGSPPSEVAAVVSRAVACGWPRPRYLVGKRAPAGRTCEAAACISGWRSGCTYRPRPCTAYRTATCSR